MSVKRETYRDLTFSGTTKWSNTHHLRFQRVQRSCNPLEKSCTYRDNHKGRHDRYKSKRVVVWLRSDDDFSLEGEISLGGMTMTIKVLRFPL